MVILLIGNGFDLEHNLPTSYGSFLEFCQKTKRLFTALESDEDYQRDHLDNWTMDPSIKDRLLQAFQGRQLQKSEKNGTLCSEFTTQNMALNELYLLIEDNAWLEYFQNATSYIGENWIDFEAEISTVIKALDVARFHVEKGDSVTNIEEHYAQTIVAIIKAAKKNLNLLNSTNDIDCFSVFLNNELTRLTRALEIYIAEFIQKVPISKKNSEIKKINPDHVLSFNYSDTYERIYGFEKNIEYSYIHGKANVSNNLNTCNLVLGIDEYLDDDSKDTELAFLPFKKYYQRIFNFTDNSYLFWVNRIQKDYAEYIRKIELHRTGQPDPIRSLSWQKRYYIDRSSINFPIHTLYIFGHSLDVTDKDVLRQLICNDNVETKIFYYRKHEDDKMTLGKLVRNLVKVIGQEELIRRTGGPTKTIEFIPQSLHATDLSSRECIGQSI